MRLSVGISYMKDSLYGGALPYMTELSWCGFNRSTEFSNTTESSVEAGEETFS